MNGNIACGLTGKDELMLRVGAERYEELLRKPDAREMDFTGRPMKGMIFIDPASCPDPESLAAWLEEGLLFARSLPKK